MKWELEQLYDLYLNYFDDKTKIRLFCIMNYSWYKRESLCRIFDFHRLKQPRVYVEDQVPIGDDYEI